MMHYACAKKDGEIIQVVSCRENDLIALRNNNPGYNYIPCTPEVTTDTHWVCGRSVKEKAVLNYACNKRVVKADGVDSVVITKLPKPCRVLWPDHQIMDVQDGVIEFSVDLPGTYTLEILSISYKNSEVTIEAVAATES